jgi:hypothetical protein
VAEHSFSAKPSLNFASTYDAIFIGFSIGPLGRNTPKWDVKDQPEFQDLQAKLDLSRPD